VWSPAPGLTLSSSEQAILNAISDSNELPVRVRVRARIILKAGEGIPNNRIAGDLQMKRPRVLHWRRRYHAQGIRGLWDADRTPRRKPIPEEVEQAVVFDCLYRWRLDPNIPRDNDPSLRWNIHNLAARHGISPASVGRIWKKHGIRIARLRGIELEKLKISPDPLFPLTVFQLGGLLYNALGPVVAFCSCERPFSELVLSDLPVSKRYLKVDRLSAEFQTLDRVRYDDVCQKLSNGERPSLALDKLGRFVAAVSARYQEAQIHLLFADHILNPHDYPVVRRWLAAQPRLHLHYTPVAMPNGQRWTEFAEHWLKTIANWPMQASLVQGIEEMTRILEAYPNDELDDLVIC